MIPKQGGVFVRVANYAGGVFLNSAPSKCQHHVRTHINVAVAG